MAGAPTIILGTPVDGTGTSATVSKPSGLIDGDVIGVAVRAQGTISGELTLPTLFARGFGTQPTGERAQGIFYKKIPVAASESPTTYSFSGFGSGRWVATPFIIRGTDPTTPIAGGYTFVTSATATLAIPSFVADDTPFTVVAMWGDERTAGNSYVPSSKPSGYTDVSNYQSGGAASGTTGSRTAYYLGSKAVAEGASTTEPSASLTWPGSAAANKAMSVAFLGIKAPTTPMGTPIKNESGTASYLSYLDGSAVRTAPTAVHLWAPGFASVTALLAKAGATFSHRGGSLLWPEYSEIAYDRSVMAGYGALEFSCAWTSDLVPFGLGDQYLDRVSGVSGSIDPTTMTWATLNATYRNTLRPISAGVTQPYYKLVDFLAKYTPLHVVAVDPKFGFSNSTKVAAMLDICDANGGPSRIIIKFDSPTADTVMTTAAHARGYLCMNYWGGVANSSAMAAQQGNWDIIGALYNDATMMAQANTYGKPVWAAVVPNAAGYATGMTNGADFVMCTDPINIAPVSSWN